MPPLEPKFNTHDNIDREVVVINKSSLLLVKECEQRILMPHSMTASIGATLTLGTSALLTEKFHDAWSIPGETIRSAFIFGTIAALVSSVYFCIRWFQTKRGKPEDVIAHLFQNKQPPLAFLAEPKKTIADTPTFATPKKHSKRSLK